MIFSSKRPKLGLDLSSLIMRLAFGGMMLYSHGYGKFMRYFDGEAIKFSDPLGIGPELSFGLVVFAEVLCAALVMLGLFTRMATIPLIITMVVVAFIVQIDGPFNKIEFASLYLVGFTSILLAGPGRISLDALLGKKK